MNRYMKYACLLIPVMTLLVGGCRGVEVPAHPPLTTPADPHPHINGVVLPSATNVVRFRLYTNAAPDALRLFNTFEIEAFGQTLLSSPQGDSEGGALALLARDRDRAVMGFGYRFYDR